MWELGNNVLVQYGLAAFVCLAALAGMGVAVWRIWKRNGELSLRNEALAERLAKVGGEPDVTTIKDRHEEVVSLLKTLRFAYSGDGDVMKKLNEILDIEQKLFEAHLGPGAKDEEGRLKWWGASRIEELLGEITERCSARIEALQEQRLKEAQAAGHRIDELQEKRVSEAHVMVRESMTILQENQKSSERIEALRKKINGESDRDDEPTLVTKLLEELGECASETKEELEKTGKAAVQVSRLTRRKNRSYPKLKMLLSTPPPPPPEEADE
jgi:hypothetical protein